MSVGHGKGVFENCRYDLMLSRNRESSQMQVVEGVLYSAMLHCNDVAAYGRVRHMTGSHKFDVPIRSFWSSIINQPDSSVDLMLTPKRYKGDSAAQLASTGTPLISPRSSALDRRMPNRSGYHLDSMPPNSHDQINVGRTISGTTSFARRVCRDGYID